MDGTEEIRYSKHALARMKQRKISPAEVEGVLRDYHRHILTERETHFILVILEDAVSRSWLGKVLARHL